MICHNSEQNSDNSSLVCITEAKLYTLQAFAIFYYYTHITDFFLVLGTDLQ